MIASTIHITSHPFPQIYDSIVNCERCPRLRNYCQGIGETKRRAYLDHTYWARPVPGFGDAHAKFLIIGLAPGAHGANRTGRVFTGDRSGDFLYPQLYRAGFANQPSSRQIDDGLTLRNAYISAAIRCAPPLSVSSRRYSSRDQVQSKPWARKASLKASRCSSDGPAS